MIDESISGYILRLAMANGWHTPSKFMSVLGWPSQVSISIVNSALIERLHKITGHDELLNKNYFLPDNDKVFERQSGTVFSSMAISHVQLCPMCLGEHSHHRSTWLYLPFTHCIEHQQRLLQCCPHCDETFKWNNSLLGSGCSNCGYTWQEMISQPTSVPDYLSKYVTSNNKLKYLMDLMATAQRIIRPFDELLDHNKRLPNAVLDWSPILERAYSLLTDLDYSSKWLSLCVYERRDVKNLGVKALNAPATKLLEELKSDGWAISTLNLNVLTSSNALKLKSTTTSNLPARLSKTTTDNDLKYQTDIQGLDRIIGCEKYISVILSQQGIFTRLNKNRRPNSSLYDVRELQHFISTIPNVIPESKLSLIHSYEWLFHLFNASWQDVLLGIFKKELNVELTDNLYEPLMNRFMVSRFRMLYFLSKNLKHQADNNFTTSMKAICSTLVITQPELMTLVTEGMITPFKMKRPLGRYRVSDCISFLDNYWLLCRWANIHQRCQEEVLEYLRVHNIEGTISKYVFIRSQTLKKALRNYLHQYQPPEYLDKPVHTPLAIFR
jgi:hypothetical protein